MSSTNGLISARDHYLHNPVVDGFCRYLAQYLKGKDFNPVYTTETLRPKAFYCIASLEDGYEQYLKEKGNALPFARMRDLRLPMIEALKAGDNQKMRALIDSLYDQRLNKNNYSQWFDSNQAHLCELLNFACDILSSDSPDYRLFGTEQGPRMSAVLSRIYAIVLGNFLTYESRVSATTCLFIREYCRTNDMALPQELCLSRLQGWGKNKKDNGRNASWGNNQFPMLDAMKRRHKRESEFARANILASWLVDRALQLTFEDGTPDWLKGETPMRNVEAAFYMMGATLPPPDSAPGI